jgi:hypothetical protein
MHPSKSSRDQVFNARSAELGVSAQIGNYERTRHATPGHGENRVISGARSRLGVFRDNSFWQKRGAGPRSMRTEAGSVLTFLLRSLTISSSLVHESCCHRAAGNCCISPRSSLTGASRGISIRGVFDKDLRRKPEITGLKRVSAIY